jgi:hypothetical protein
LATRISTIERICQPTRASRHNVTADAYHQFVLFALTSISEHGGRLVSVGVDSVVGFWESTAATCNPPSAELDACRASQVFAKRFKRWKAALDRYYYAAQPDSDKRGAPEIHYGVGIARGAVLRANIATERRGQLVVDGPCLAKAAIIARVAMHVRASILLSRTAASELGGWGAVRAVDAIEFPADVGIRHDPAAAVESVAAPAVVPVPTIAVAAGDFQMLAASPTIAVAALTNDSTHTPVNHRGARVATETLFQLLRLHDAPIDSKAASGADTEWMYQLERSYIDAVRASNAAFDAWRRGEMLEALHHYTSVLQTGQVMGARDRLASHRVQVIASALSAMAEVESQHRRLSATGNGQPAVAVSPTGADSTNAKLAPLPIPLGSDLAHSRALGSGMIFPVSASGANLASDLTLQVSAFPLTGSMWVDGSASALFAGATGSTTVAGDNPPTARGGLASAHGVARGPSVNTNGTNPAAPQLSSGTASSTSLAAQRKAAAAAIHASVARESVPGAAVAEFFAALRAGHVDYGRSASIATCVTQCFDVEPPIPPATPVKK